MRLVFMGSPEFARPALRRLVEAGHHIVAVYTQPDRPAGRGRHLSAPPVKGVALELGLTVYQPPSLRPPEEVARLRELAPEAIVVAAYGLLLRPEVLAIPPHGCLNLHPSLLPKYRGPAPVAAAILAGEEKTGVTLMLLDPGMDSGPILAQVKVAIAPEDTTGSLAEKLAQMGAELLLEKLPLWVEGKLTPQPQDEATATFSHRLTKEEGELDLRLSARELWLRVRAFQPWPGAFTRFQGRRLEVLEAAPLPSVADAEPGQVVAGPPLADEAPWGVACGEGVLGLRRVQLEGRRPIAAAEFFRGQHHLLGQRLPS